MTLMYITAMNATTSIRLFHKNILFLLRLATLFLVVNTRMVTLVTLPLILFLQILGIDCTLLWKHLTLRGRLLLGLRMRGRMSPDGKKKHHQANQRKLGDKSQIAS